MKKQILQILLKYLKKDKIINGYYVQMKASEVRFCFKGRRVRNLANTFYITVDKRKEK